MSTILLIVVFTLFVKKAVSSKSVFNIYFISASTGFYYLIISPLFIEFSDISLFGFYNTNFNYLRYFAVSYYLAFFVGLGRIRSAKTATLAIRPEISHIVLLMLLLCVLVFGIVGPGLVELNSLNFINISLPVFLFVLLIVFASTKSKLRRSFYLALGTTVSLTSGFRIRVLLFLLPLLTLLRSLTYLRLLVVGLFLPPLFSVIEIVRVYGSGFDPEKLSSLTIDSVSFLPLGELGPPVISAVILETTSAFGTVFFAPFIEGFTRLLPAILVGEKGLPELQVYINTVLLPIDYEYAGVAPLVLGELYFQFGFIGGIIGGCFHGLIYRFIHNHVFSRYSGQFKVISIGYLSVFFGYYFFSRGYFFQVFSELIFVLFFLGICTRKIKKNTAFSSTSKSIAKKAMRGRLAHESHFSPIKSLPQDSGESQ